MDIEEAIRFESDAARRKGGGQKTVEYHYNVAKWLRELRTYKVESGELRHLVECLIRATEVGADMSACKARCRYSGECAAYGECTLLTLSRWLGVEV